MFYFTDTNGIATEGNTSIKPSIDLSSMKIHLLDTREYILVKIDA